MSRGEKGGRLEFSNVDKVKGEYEEEGPTASSLAGTRSSGLEVKWKVVETWMAGATSVVRFRWSSA